MSLLRSKYRLGTNAGQEASFLVSDLVAGCFGASTAEVINSPLARHLLNKQRTHCDPDRPFFKGAHEPLVGSDPDLFPGVCQTGKADYGSPPELPFPYTKPGPPTEFKGKA